MHRERDTHKQSGRQTYKIMEQTGRGQSEREAGRQHISRRQQADRQKDSQTAKQIVGRKHAGRRTTGR